MKRAFTLVEMLIVIAILSILMTITFRLLKTGDEDTKRTNTLIRLHKLENCLSGYYAAFGSYPPVKLHGSRDIYCAVDNFGDQMSNQSRGSTLDWDQVRSACRSQPFGCEYPPGEAELKAIRKWANGEGGDGKTDDMSKRIGSYAHYGTDQYGYAYAFNGALSSPDCGKFGITRPPKSLSDWEQVKVFRFGVMSFLLPRYLFMMRNNDGWFGDGSYTVCAQWSDNNDMPSDPLKGASYAQTVAHGETGWSAVKELAGGNDEDEDRDASDVRRDRARVENIPSQAVCARWMPNLEGLCQTAITEKFFGINITGGSWLRYDNGWTSNLDDPKAVYPPSPLPIHATPGSNGNGQGYCNGWITVQDGWSTEFYYYSPAPYQSYMLWSSGPNHRTFPPWVSLEELSAKDRETAMDWMGDDIMGMGEGMPNAKVKNAMDTK